MFIVRKRRFTRLRDFESGEQDGWPSFSLKQIIKVNICAFKPSRAAANALLERFSKKIATRAPFNKLVGTALFKLSSKLKSRRCHCLQIFIAIISLLNNVLVSWRCYQKLTRQV
ncbi:hypothetical protein T4B_13924 [Trichinella pseudospiralis]|uniref:Uncharacterized protein n=2 Tax=Trichinella pseudospiralis TaxID=6337 RepID=A0A0V1JJS4_TRIPS|nr:hypothetical protein T4E_982 [Trichinella pseudospiralis]KRY81678.1 hypothetical protein T4D_8739 [Trichinella pseudospiralis]KRZ07977.1 hypothetical protein T4B_13924 [Trichinella pseudospiralis]KRZ35204.1 hypothetical protein T4C_13444 [Trichinella pseudospiralis]